MKINSDYTNVMNSSNEQIVKCGILPNNDVQDQIRTLNISSSDDEEVTISKCNNSASDEQLCILNNSSCSLKIDNNSSVMNNLNKTEIVDNFLESNTSIRRDINLDNAFDECLIKMNNDLSLIGNIIPDDLLFRLESKIYSNKHNHKKKMLHPKKCNINYNCDIDSNKNNKHSCAKNKKIRTMSKIKGSSDIPRRKPKSRREITVGIPNIFTDQSSELEQFKKTLERFLQKSICLSLPARIGKCIECRIYQMKKNLTKIDYDNISCRFYAFRQLKFTKSGKLAVAGYPDPFTNLNNIDLSIWLPSQHSTTPSSFNIEASMKILEDTGGQFCKFVQDEEEALKLDWTKERKKRKIVWKKSVNGFREMCDMCRTTIFNYHWSCGKCGFVVCVDCFKCKLKGNHSAITQNLTSEYNKKNWLLCSDREEHQIDQLAITQILAGDTLNCISMLMHNLCSTKNIPIDCNCNCNKNSENKVKYPILNDPVSDMFLEDSYGTCGFEKDDGCSELSNLLKKGYSDYCMNYETEESDNSSECTYNSSINFSECIENKSEYRRKREVFTPQLSLIIDSKTDPSHTWLCEGHLLQLLYPENSDNYELFQKQWKRGQPVLVSDVGKNLKDSLWHPESFIRDFGDQNNDLIDCETTKVINNQPMRKFWDGFEDASKRLLDKQGNPMLLKLKDWPPSADFAETLPDRFKDLMDCLPLKEYTQRNGRLNLASRLPECFVRPDLGPKMYTAYGNAGSNHKNLGTTNLHLDISDAVNVMVYVAVTRNCSKNNYDWYIKQALKVIDEAGCDDLTRLRVHVHGEIPGALWHIYHASDADFIRDLLIKVAVEHGKPLEKFSDPIHDQSHYLDEYLRDRLFREYGVKGYTIVQCSGDAVFIPAGAPHQVRNLHNCIKVAEDFVSPENVHHSFRMTQEFRNLTDSHTNHEDKLQIKNIVFHAIKDSISVLMHNSNNKNFVC